VSLAVDAARRRGAIEEADEKLPAGVARAALSLARLNGVLHPLPGGEGIKGRG